jgi:hypothetical protein
MLLVVLSLDLVLHLLFLFCRGLVDNTYPKEYTNNNKGRVVIKLMVIFYATEKIGLNILISKEHSLTILLLKIDFTLS